MELKPPESASVDSSQKSAVIFKVKAVFKGNKILFQNEMKAESAWDLLQGPYKEAFPGIFLPNNPCRKEAESRGSFYVRTTTLLL